MPARARVLAFERIRALSDEGDAGPIPPAPPSALAEQPPAPPPSAAVLGIPLAITDHAQVIEWIDATIAAGSRGSISAAAVHLVMRAQDEPAVMEAVLGLSLVVPDGQPWSGPCTRSDTSGRHASTDRT